MARIWQIVQWVVVRCFNCQQIWSGCRTQSEIHTQFTCIVLAALALFSDFIGGFSHLRIFFMATSSFILNAMQKSRADNERKWIMFEAQHLTSPCSRLILHFWTTAEVALYCAIVQHCASAFRVAQSQFIVATRRQTNKSMTARLYCFAHRNIAFII